MRIISGLAKGIRLNAPLDKNIRPTEDRVKESVFGTLGDLSGKTVVDLFAGSGALGLEALSRGASMVYFVERERRHVRLIEENLMLVLKAMDESSSKAAIICGDAKSTPLLLPQLSGKVDVVLADPPYTETAKTYGANALIADEAFAEWAGSQCLLSLEHASTTILRWYPLSRWELLREKEFGIRAVSFARIGRDEYEENNRAEE